MMQFDPNTYWSLWHLVGFFLTAPIVFYWAFLKKKWIGNEKIEGNTIPLNIVKRYLVVIAIPFIAAGAFDVIAGLVLYPVLINQMLVRGLTYYGGLLGALVFFYLIFIVINWMQKDPWDTSTKLVINEKET